MLDTGRSAVARIHRVTNATTISTMTESSDRGDHPGVLRLLVRRERHGGNNGTDLAAARDDRDRDKPVVAGVERSPLPEESFSPPHC